MNISIVFCLGNNFLFKSILTGCARVKGSFYILMRIILDRSTWVGKSINEPKNRTSFMDGYQFIDALIMGKTIQLLQSNFLLSNKGICILLNET